MTQQFIVTTPANTGTGDSPKAAFDKINAMFTELYTSASGISGAINITTAPYSADPTGATDSTAAFIAAGATGKLIYAPTGAYKVSDSITLAGGGIVGDGAYLTYINTTSTNSNNVFNYLGANAGRFENFQLQTQTGPGQKAGGYGVSVGPIIGEVSDMRFWQVVMNNLPNDIDFVRASLFGVKGCNFYGFTGIGVNVDNQNNGDSGDSSLEGCTLTSLGNASAIGINQVSSGGLRVVNNKLNNLSVGYLLNLGTVVGGSSTSDLIIVGNSIENCSNSAIQLQRQGGSTATFANVNIGDNQILVSGASATGIYSNDSSGFLSTVDIAGNVIKVTGTSGATAVLLNYVTNFLVDDNTLQGSGGSSTGILCGTSSAAGRIGINQIQGFANSVNASTGVAITKGDIQRGTVVCTTSTGYGALFAGTNSVTYPTAYDADVTVNITDVVVSPNGTANGAISAMVTGATNTGFSVYAIGINNGGTVTVDWEAKGVI